MSVASCVFCKIVAGQLPSTMVTQEDRAVAFLDISPATPGHLLIIPRAHASDLFDIGPDDLSACASLAQRMACHVRDRLGADGVNLIQSSGSVAWQTVFHLHIHVIPRYSGDPLRLPWRPKPGDPTELASVAAKLVDS